MYTYHHLNFQTTPRLYSFRCDLLHFLPIIAIIHYFDFWKKCVPDIFFVENCQQLLLFQQYELQTTHFYAYPLQIIRQDCLHSEIDANFILAQYSFLQKCFWNSLEDITYRRYSSLICFHFLWYVLSKWREICFRFFFL